MVFWHGSCGSSFFNPALPINESDHNEIAVKNCPNNLHFHGISEIYTIIVPSLVPQLTACLWRPFELKHSAFYRTRSSHAGKKAVKQAFWASLNGTTGHLGRLSRAMPSQDVDDVFEYIKSPSKVRLVDTVFLEMATRREMSIRGLNHLLAMYSNLDFFDWNYFPPRALRGCHFNSSIYR